MKIYAICYAGGKSQTLSKHESVKDARVFYGATVKTTKSIFVPPIGYIKLLRKNN